VDLSVKLWELPTKTTELGSSGSYLSWVWRQLDMSWTANWPTTRAGWLRPQETHLLEAPLGKAPFPIDVPLGQPWEGLVERVQCLGWRLQDGGYKEVVILAGWCVKRHTRSPCLFKEFKCSAWGGSWQPWPSRDAPLCEETHPLVKRHAPSRVCDRRPSPPFPYK